MGVFKRYSFLHIALLLLFAPLTHAYDLREFPDPFVHDGKFEGMFVVDDNAPAEDVIAVSDLATFLSYEISDKNPEEELYNPPLQDTLPAGQTRTYEIRSVLFEVTLQSVDANSASFSVNGENFQLELEEVYSLADGTLLGFVSVDDSGTGSATFFLADQSSISSIEVSAAKLASEVEDITSTNSIIVGLPCDHYLLREVGKEEGSCDYKRKIGYIESYVLPNGKVSIVISGRTGDDRLLAASALAKFQENKESLKGQSLEVVEDNGAIIIKPRSRAGNGTSSQEANRDNLELTIKIAGFLIAAVIVFVFLWRKKDSQILGRKMPNRKEKPKRTFK